jgi:epoxyqueuosine reductase
MDLEEKAQLVRDLAADVGVSDVGIARAGPIARGFELQRWLEQGRHGQMDYMARTAAERSDPRRLLPGSRSIIVAADAYNPATESADKREPDSSPRGRIARYAWGRDYHRVLRGKLKQLADRLHEAMEEPFESRVCVDTAPILEREVAAAAGLGWIGKNAMLIHPKLGSYLFLGEILTTLGLSATEPMPDRCGSCTRCLEACPTCALDAPHRMDARRCISYLNIEHRAPIDPALAPLMGTWVFGCDMCQEVCPYNRKAPPGREPAYQLDVSDNFRPQPPLEAILQWSEQDRQAQLAGTAMKRAKLSMWHRNAAIAMANYQAAGNVRKEQDGNSKI